MVKIGDQVEFTPYAYLYGRGINERTSGRMPEECVIVIGTVIYINECNMWFLVEYGNTNQHMGFKFQDLGEAVNIVGSETKTIIKPIYKNMHRSKSNLYREQSIGVARDLNYSQEIIEKIKNAKSDAEISNILVTARKRKFDKDI